MRETLKFTIEDKEIAQLFGRQNFSSEQSAVLEIIKNAYDAGAFNVTITISRDSIEIIDDGKGMAKDTIRTKWMVVGKSDKEYSFVDANGNKRVLSGSKGVGRFALARLGSEIELITKTNESDACIWNTDWSTSTVDDCYNCPISHGTLIKIRQTNDRWNEKRAESLSDYLKICQNFEPMRVVVLFEEKVFGCNNPFTLLKLGDNYLSSIALEYNNIDKQLNIKIDSEEFNDEASEFIKKAVESKNKYAIDCLDTKHFEKTVAFYDEDFDDYNIPNILTIIGSFKATFFYSNQPSKYDCERFLYKKNPDLKSFVYPIDGITLYRNSFSLANYERENDWLELSRRVIKSPAAATHRTGKWRVRANQLCGYVVIDKNENSIIKEMQNRQGIENDEYFDCFKRIVLMGISCFEEYRQAIIRVIDERNVPFESKKSSKSIIDSFLRNPKKDYDRGNRIQLASAIGDERESFKSKEEDFTKKKNEYEYALRLLNSLSTLGLKSSLFAHKIDNRRNAIESFNRNTIRILKQENVWDLLNGKEYDSLADSLPYQLENIKNAHNDIINFVDTSLDSIKSDYLEVKELLIDEAIKCIVDDWKLLYEEKSPTFVCCSASVKAMLPFNIIKTIFDNLILNSLQQNDERNDLCITINVVREDGGIRITYSDNGVGLARKYMENPRKILEPFETTRKKDGHGLGMWIVSNCINSAKGKVISIGGSEGFVFEFFLHDILGGQ